VSKVEALPQTPPKAGLWNPLLKQGRSRGGPPLMGLGRARPYFVTVTPFQNATRPAISAAAAFGSG